MSQDLIDIFGELNCPLINDIDLDSLSLIDFARLLNWISLQLNFFCKTDSLVNLIKGLFLIDFFLRFVSIHVFFCR